MKFLALNSDFSIILGLRRPAQASIKEGDPLKSGYFTASVKTVANMHRHAAYHNKL